jgi:hypothetical protein
MNKHIVSQANARQAVRVEAKLIPSMVSFPSMIDGIYFFQVI